MYASVIERNIASCCKRLKILPFIPPLDFRLLTMIVSFKLVISRRWEMTLNTPMNFDHQTTASETTTLQSKGLLSMQHHKKIKLSKRS